MAFLFARLRIVFSLFWFLFEVLRLAKRGDALHEFERQGLVERKLHRALAELVAAEFRRKVFNALRAGVKADVVRKRGKVDDVAV